jgi:hypothetical protein
MQSIQPPIHRLHRRRVTVLSAALGFLFWPVVTRAQVSGSQLTTKQVAELKRKPVITAVIPTFLPAGYRVTRFETYRGKYINGDDELGYQIHYRGADNTCLYVGSTQSGPRGMVQVASASTALGPLKVYKDPQSGVLAAFPPLDRAAQISSSKYNSQGCRALSSNQFIRIVESIKILK